MWKLLLGVVTVSWLALETQLVQGANVDSSGKRIRRSPPDGSCYSGVDILQVQDVTSSFDFVWDSMADQIPRVLQRISDTHSESRFGFVIFTDKPIRGSLLSNPNKPHILGYQNDFCLDALVPLGKPDGDSMSDMVRNMSRKVRGGGGDWPEAVLEALTRATLSPESGWQDVKKAEEFGHEVRSRVIVLVTDALSHVAGDVLTLTSIELPPFNLTSEELGEHGSNYRCDEVEYASEENLVEALNAQNISLFVLAAPGGFYDANNEFQPYETVARYGPRYWGPDNLKLWYEDYFADIGVNAFVAELDLALDVYADAFESALDDFLAWRCATESTTDEPKMTTAAKDTTKETPTTTEVQETLTTPAPTQEATDESTEPLIIQPSRPAEETSSPITTEKPSVCPPGCNECGPDCESSNCVNGCECRGARIKIQLDIHMGSKCNNKADCESDSKVTTKSGSSGEDEIPVEVTRRFRPAQDQESESKIESDVREVAVITPFEQLERKKSIN